MNSMVRTHFIKLDIVLWWISHRIWYAALTFCTRCACFSGYVRLFICFCRLNACGEIQRNAWVSASACAWQRIIFHKLHLYSIDSIDDSCAPSWRNVYVREKICCAVLSVLFFSQLTLHHVRLFIGYALNVHLCHFCFWIFYHEQGLQSCCTI